MRPTLGHTRPCATRYRPAPLVPGSLAWTIAEVYRVPLETLRDTESAFMRAINPLSLSEGTPPSQAAQRAAMPGRSRLAPVWSAAEAEMVDGEPVWSTRNQRRAYDALRAREDARR